VHENGKTEEPKKSFKDYMNTNIELIKHQATNRCSVIGSESISVLFIGFTIALFILFVSLAAGFYLSTLTGDNYSVFGIVTGIYLLLGVIVLTGRKKLLEKPLRDKIITKVFSKN